MSSLLFTFCYQHVTVFLIKHLISLFLPPSPPLFVHASPLPSLLIWFTLQHLITFAYLPPWRCRSCLRNVIFFRFCKSYLCLYFLGKYYVEVCTSAKYITTNTVKFRLNNELRHLNSMLEHGKCITFSVCVFVCIRKMERRKVKREVWRGKRKGKGREEKVE